MPTQTGFSPDHRENNISSLYIDVVTLRKRWLAISSYTDGREPEPSMTMLLFPEPAKTDRSCAATMENPMHGVVMVVTG